MTNNVLTAFYSRSVFGAIVLSLILVAGFALRVANLGGPDFGVDETFHVYAAQSMIEGDALLLPSGISYTRSLPYTRTVAWAGALFGDVNEWTARVPSVLFGCLTIVLVFIIGRRWYSSGAGLVAAFVTAVAPMQVAFSRQVRMYALLQLLYLVIIYLIFEGCEASSSKRRPWVPQRFDAWCTHLEIRPLLLLVAAPILLLARQTHDLILPSLAGPAAYILCMALVAPYLRIKDVASTSSVRWKYRGMALLVVVGGLVAAGLDIGSVQAGFVDAITYAPTWAQGRIDNWRWYIYAFATHYPTIFGTFLLSSLFALTVNVKATTYLIACFAVPFVLHSFVFAWKDDRYLFHTMPLMFIVFGVGLSALLPAFHGAILGWANRTVNRAPYVVAGALTLAGVLFLFGATRELREGVKLHQLDVGAFAGVQHFNWKRAMEFIGERAQPSDVVITSRSLSSRYYGPDLPLYLLNHQELDSMLTNYPRDSQGRPLDYSTGALAILDLAMLRDVIGRHTSGWFVAERPQLWDPETRNPNFVQLGSASIPADLAQFIERQLTFVPVPGADDMAVFHWGPPVHLDGQSAPLAVSGRALDASVR
jgi:hypothetical protein